MVVSDKEVKKRFKLLASKQPEKYYPVKILKKEGFSRKKCSCGTHYWTTNNSPQCGDPACSGGFRFFQKNPAKKKLDYIGVWKAFAKHFEKRGYTPIKRYPVVARWRADTEFVQASIYDFQPYVVSGEVEPPANPLVVPQFSLRFNDIDNVGITGAHYTGFVMIGQHAFMPPEKWDQEKYFEDIHSWLNKGLGLPNNEITYHEDAWAGGGNFGPCMEFFSRGLELGNQVYMLYEQTPKGDKPLNLKILDMGMGHERNAWFTQATSTSYETTFPTVCKKLKKITGIKVDEPLIKRFLPYASYLNIDEIEDHDATWKMVAKKTETDVPTLKEAILPLASLYSVAEHSRSLLVAFTDGKLPSNVGGGYNLRTLYRRAQGFIDKYNWKIEMADLTTWHADYIKQLFPELKESLNNVQKILDIEHQKYKNAKKRNKQLITQFLKKPSSSNKLVQLYDSHGVTPEEVVAEAKKENKKITPPENFYSILAELHEQKEQKTATKKQEELPLKNIPETKILYYQHHDLLEFPAKILKIVKKEFVVLDRTAFYPTSGGQLHDLGTLGDADVIDVFKQANLIIHKVKNLKAKEGQTIKGKIDADRRIQLAQHHTATHIINGAAKRILGDHIWQAGAAKTVEKSRIDITHFDALTDEEMKKIEQLSNKIVHENRTIYKTLLPRNQAESKYGFRLYQGGVVPGNKIRVVDITNFDVEACGGTHLDLTGDVGEIKLLKSTKVQDGIVRIEFKAGKAAKKEEEQTGNTLQQTAKLLDCNPNQIPGRANELFTLWKQIVKKKKQISFKLTTTDTFNGDPLTEAARILRTQKEHVPNVIQRFLKDIEKN